MTWFRFPSMLKQSLLTIALLGIVGLPSPITIAQSSNSNQQNRMTVRSNRQEANSETGVITATGNVEIRYPIRNLEATSAQAQYYQQDRRLVLTGNVHVQQGENSIRAEKVTYFVEQGRIVATPKQNQQVKSSYVIPEGEKNTQDSQPQLDL